MLASINNIIIFSIQHDPKNQTCFSIEFCSFSWSMKQYRHRYWELISNNKFSNLVCLLVLVTLARGDFNGIRDYKKVLLDNWLMFLLLLLLDWFIVFSILNMVTEVLILVVLAIHTCIYFLYKWSNDKWQCIKTSCRQNYSRWNLFDFT